jgi:ADP-ribose diphosphatase
LQFSNNEKRQYERLMRGHNYGGAVLIIPLLDKETVLLIREYSAN